MSPKKIAILCFSAVAFIISFGVFQTMYAKVPPGNVGIIVNNLGDPKGVAPQEAGVGYVWLGFFKNLYLFPTFQQNYTWTKSPHEGQPVDESITFQTSEGLEVNADFGISFKIDPDKTSKLFQTYRKGIAEITDIYVRNHVRDAVNEVASKMKAEQIYGLGKTGMLLDVTNKVKEKIQDVGLIIDQVYIIGNFRFPETFVAALNAKLEAQQRASQRENEVAEAKAQANKEVAKAEGDAKAMLTRAQAEAQANKLKLQTLTRELIQYESVQKWDGKLPQITGSGATPFINLNVKDSK